METLNSVTYPKFKEGEGTVREVKVEQNYGNYGISLLHNIFWLYEVIRENI